MSDKPADYGREVRDTVVKSSLTGVAATVLAVTVFSPAGLGGVVGVSAASNAGGVTSREDPYSRLPPFPSPLTGAELEAVHAQLAATEATLDSIRSATDARIEYIRSIAIEGAPAFAHVQQAELLTDDDLRSRIDVAQPQQAAAPVVEAAELQALPLPASERSLPIMEAPDPHLELAELLLPTSTR